MSIPSSWGGVGGRGSLPLLTGASYWEGGGAWVGVGVLQRPQLIANSRKVDTNSAV